MRGQANRQRQSLPGNRPADRNLARSSWIPLSLACLTAPTLAANAQSQQWLQAGSAKVLYEARLEDTEAD